MHSDGIKITPPYVFFSTKDIGVTVAIRTARGDAVIAMDVTVNDLSRLLASLRITPASEIAIVDQTNHVVAYPDQGRLFVNEKNHSRLSSLEELGIPVSTINTQKSRALLLLKKSLSGAGIALLMIYS